MPGPTEFKATAAGIAALSICELLLLALGDLKIMGVKEVAGVLEDAAAAHRTAGDTSYDAALHVEVAAIIERIMAGGNSTLHP